MLRTMLDARPLVAMIVAAGVGTWGLSAYPLPMDNVFLEIMALRNPAVLQLLGYTYATFWFTTPFLATSLLLSVLAIVAYHRLPSTRAHPLPHYPLPEHRSTPTLVLGEAHFTSTPTRAPDPTWLTIPQRGLYTGVMILGAMGTGKTSACMYPYVNQLLRWRADDPDRKLGGLVLEVKGDFCHQVRSMLAQAGRHDDYLEVGLDTGVCYNPLHNDLDPYAVAYAVATLLNNLFGKSKEPFWQQAYTDLLKFVISLRRITDGYTTLAEVYRYIIEDDKIDKNIRTLKAQFGQPQEMIAIRCEDYQGPLRQLPWTLWTPDGVTHVMHPYDAELDAHLAGHGIPFEVRTGDAAICADRRHRLEAIDRWFTNTWRKLDSKVKASIVEGVVVFLSLVRREPRGLPRLLPTARRLCRPRQTGPTPTAPAARRPTRNRPRVGPQLSGGPQPGACPRAGGDAQTRFPAGRPAAHPQDHGPPRTIVARSPLRR